MASSVNRSVSTIVLNPENFVGDFQNTIQKSLQIGDLQERITYLNACIANYETAYEKSFQTHEKWRAIQPQFRAAVADAAKGRKEAEALQNRKIILNPTNFVEQLNQRIRKANELFSDLADRKEYLESCIKIFEQTYEKGASTHPEWRAIQPAAREAIQKAKQAKGWVKTVLYASRSLFLSGLVALGASIGTGSVSGSIGSVLTIGMAIVARKKLLQPSLNSTAASLLSKSPSIAQPIQPPSPFLLDLPETDTIHPQTPSLPGSPKKHSVFGDTKAPSSSMDKEEPKEASQTKTTLSKSDGSTKPSKESDGLPEWLLGIVGRDSRDLPHVPGQPPGIPNTGNTCYAASATHFIANLKPLFDLLTSPSQDHFLGDFFLQYRQEKEAGVSSSEVPMELVGSQSPYAADMGGVNDQQDAAALVRGILSNLKPETFPLRTLKTYASFPEGCDLKKSSFKYVAQNDPNLSSLQDRADQIEAAAALQDQRAPRKMRIAASEQQTREVPFLEVDLFQQGKQINPLKKLLEEQVFSRRFADPIRIEGKEEDPLAIRGVKLLETLQFNKLSDVLILNLTKTEAFRTAGSNPSVLVPMDLAYPAKGTLNGEKGDFELKTFVVQSGSVRGGHYVSYVKTMSPSGSAAYWQCDDSLVTEIDLQAFEEKAKKAYLLGYVKKPTTSIR